MTVNAPSAQPFYHGTRADLKQGDLIGPGYACGDRHFTINRAKRGNKAATTLCCNASCQKIDRLYIEPPDLSRTQWLR